MKDNAAPKKKDIDYSALFAVGLFVIMLLGILSLSAVGGNLFDKITVSRSGNIDYRSALSYVSTRILSSDESGALECEDTEYGDTLVLKDPAGGRGYETRLYVKDGYLTEAISRADEESVSGEEQQIAKTEIFTVDIDGQTVTVTTDDGVRSIYLHTAQ